MKREWLVINQWKDGNVKKIMLKNVIATLVILHYLKYSVWVNGSFDDASSYVYYLQPKFIEYIVVEKYDSEHERWENCFRSPWIFGETDFSMVWSGDLPEAEPLQR